MVLKDNETGLIRYDQITIKIDTEKNEFEVLQNSILHVFCYKICTFLVLRGKLRVKEATMES